MALLLREDLEAYDLDCVQTIVMGGAASPPAMVREAMARFDAAYSIRYSSTESGGCGTGTDVRRRRGGGAVHRRPPARRHRDRHLRRRRGSAARRRGRRGVAPLPHLDERVLARRGRHRARASSATGCAPATSASSTSAAACGSPGASRRCSSAVATTCTRPRWRRCWPTTRSVADVAIVPRPDDVMGEIGVAVVVPGRPGGAAHARRAADVPRAEAGAVQAAGGDPVRRTPSR